MIEQVNDIVLALNNARGGWDTEMSPAMFRNISNFIETLQKVHTFIRNQVDMNIVQRITRRLENEAQLNDCNAALQQSMTDFSLQSGLSTAATIAEANVYVNKQYDELMEHLASWSRSSFASSSSSLSILLPGSPKIFHGRETETEHLVGNLLSPTPSCTAVLGPGGIGKSSLALAALHHPDVVAAFGDNRFFIPLDSASSSESLLSVIAAHFGLEQQGKVMRSIMKYLSDLTGPSVLVLDNFESPWEAQNTRSSVEDVLSNLADVPCLHIIVTMRGSERPANMRWSRPFLPPLGTLNRSAARETFLDIVDKVADDTQLETLLDLTDNVPLAVTLLANLTSYEGGQSVLRRWSTETTSLLSAGADKQTNLDKSIGMSLSSPRITALPNAIYLLSLLSLLPDGIPEAALAEISLPFGDVAKCRVALSRTSLVYIGRDRRIKVLAPIREYMRVTYPLPPHTFRPLKAYIYSLVRLCHNFELLPSKVATGLVRMLSSNLGNIQTVVMRAVDAHESPSEFKETIICAIDLAEFSHFTDLAPWSYQLVAGLLDTVKSLDERQLLGHYLFTMGLIHAVQPSYESFMKDALQCFEDVGDVFSQARACVFLSMYYLRTGQALKALDICGSAVHFAEASGDIAQLAEVFTRLSQTHQQLGHYNESLKYAREGWLKARSAGSMLVEARAIRQYAYCCVRVGDYARSMKLCGEASVILEALDMHDVRNNTYRLLLNTQSHVHYYQTDFALSRQINVLLIGTPGAQRTQEKISEAYALVNIAGSDVRMGRCGDPTVRMNIDTARSLMTGTSNKLGVAACDLTLADLYFYQGKYRESASLCVEYLPILRGQSAEMELICRERLADIAFAEKDMGRATHLSLVLLAFALRVKDLAFTHQALRRIGDVFLVTGDPDSARNLFELALSGFTLMDIHQSRGDCLLRLGDLHRDRGEYEGARTRWTEARLMFDRSSQLGDAQRCEERLANSNIQ
ncbi:hypothetical protein B0H11DRAFT_2047551 [Mycena galericulata]|nr:hypothetical protein B0H11DRAFT_2047551 [Mycena galericulata]